MDGLEDIIEQRLFHYVHASSWEEAKFRLLNDQELLLRPATERLLEKHWQEIVATGASRGFLSGYATLLEAGLRFLQVARAQGIEVAWARPPPNLK